MSYLPEASVLLHITLLDVCPLILQPLPPAPRDTTAIDEATEGRCCSWASGPR